MSTQNMIMSAPRAEQPGEEAGEVGPPRKYGQHEDEEDEVNLWRKDEVVEEAG